MIQNWLAYIYSYILKGYQWLFLDLNDFIAQFSFGNYKLITTWTRQLTYLFTWEIFSFLWE